MADRGPVRSGALGAVFACSSDPRLALRASVRDDKGSAGSEDLAINTQSAAVPKRVNQALSALRRERLFYLVASVLSLVAAFGGFRHFYFGGGRGFGGNPLTHQVVPLILVHAAAMTGWSLLFVVQSALVYQGRLRHHRIIGCVGAGLAAAVVGLGAAMAILSAHFNPRAYMMFSGPKFFLVEMLTEIMLFGVYVAIAVAYRNRAEIHRPFILVGTVVLMSGALARLPIVADFAATAPLYAYGPVLAWGLLMFGLHSLMTRKLDRWHAFALGGVAVVFLLSLPLGRSPLWQGLWGTFIQ